jgi:hypothetical protein
VKTFCGERVEYTLVVTPALCVRAGQGARSSEINSQFPGSQLRRLRQLETTSSIPMSRWDLLGDRVRPSADRLD